MNRVTFWAATTISIVIVSWFFYRVIVPKSWKEWARAGVVQAFIIAFYAEMYGFPMTLYAMTRVFGVDVSGTFWDGNLWIYLTGAPSAMLVSMVIGYSIAFVGVGLLSAGWREVYRARKQHRLAREGPYAAVRHPQYTGIFLAVFGEGVVHWPTVFSLAAFPIIVGAYVLLARKEERQMVDTYGDQYLEYQKRVPMFFPHRGHWQRLYGREFLDVDCPRRVSDLLLCVDGVHGAPRHTLRSPGFSGTSSGGGETSSLLAEVRRIQNPLIDSPRYGCSFGYTRMSEGHVTSI